MFDKVAKKLAKTMKAKVGDTVKIASCEYEHVIKNAEIKTNYNTTPISHYIVYHSDRRRFRNEEITEIIKHESTTKRTT